MEKLDKWMLEQEVELLKALFQAAAVSTDPAVREVHGRIYVAREVRIQIAELKKKEGDDD